MKRIITLIASAALLLAGADIARAYGISNHATVAYIAEQHMTPKALKNFHKAFDNHPLVEYASYPDFYRAIYTIDGKRIGHLVKLDENMYPVPQNGKGNKALNAYDGILRAIDQLKDYRNLDDSTKVTAMALLVHFMGDSHCPSHLSYADKRDKITNIYYKKYMYDKKEQPEKIGYHGFWDSWCSDMRYPVGYMERARYFDTITDKKEIKKIQEGTVEDWIHDSAVVCQNIYDVEEEQLVDRVYITRKAEVVAIQVRNAGYRLAAVMNELFSK